MQDSVARAMAMDAAKNGGSGGKSFAIKSLEIKGTTTSGGNLQVPEIDFTSQVILCAFVRDVVGNEGLAVVPFIDASVSSYYVHVQTYGGGFVQNKEVSVIIYYVDYGEEPIKKQSSEEVAGDE